MAKRSITENIASVVILLVTFLLPLKFGTLAVLPESTAFFPSQMWEYLIISWSASSFGIFSGLALLCALIAYHKYVADWKMPSWRCMVLWSVGIPIISLLGFVNSSCFDFAIMQFIHFLSIGAWFGAIYLYCRAGNGDKLFMALMLGTLLLTWLGLEQYFWGFKQSQDFLMKQIEEGLVVNEQMKARALDNRVFATFTSCNSLAGYLLLMLCPIAYKCFSWGEKVDPPKISRILFLLVGGGAVFTVLLLTKSRGAYLCMFIGATIFTLAYPMAKKWKILIVTGVCLGVAAGGWIIYEYGRGFISMTARWDYICSAMKLWSDAPIVGYGWGEFFFGYTKIMAMVSKETAHDPHNILLMATQAGVFMVVVVGLALFYPLVKMVKMLKTEKNRPFSVAMIFGVIMVILHSLMDINSQIPAIMGGLGVVFMSALSNGESKESLAVSPLLKISSIIVMTLLAVLSIGLSLHLLRGEISFDRLITLTSRQPYQTVQSSEIITPNKVHEALAEVVKFRPYSPFGHLMATDYYLSKNMLSDAKRELDIAIELAPKRAGSYHRLALYEKLRNNEVASQKALEKAQELFPNNPNYKKID